MQQTKEAMQSTKEAFTAEARLGVRNTGERAISPKNKRLLHLKILGYKEKHRRKPPILGFHVYFGVCMLGMLGAEAPLHVMNHLES